MDIQGRTFVVTGGGAGIGRCVVEQLLDSGATVRAVDLDTGALDPLAEQHPRRLSTHRVNIADRDAVTELARAVTSPGAGSMPREGDVDGLINVAGIIQEFVGIADLDDAAMKRVIDVNFWGTVNTTKAFLPVLLERPEAAVVNVSSMGGLVPVPGQSLYGASKAAVAQFTQGLRGELRGTGVAVSVVFPGGVATDITKNSGVTTGPGGRAPADPAEGAAEGSSEDMTSKLTTPQDAAAKIVAAVVSGKPRVTIGKDAAVVDVLGRLLPATSVSLMAALMARMTRA